MKKHIVILTTFYFPHVGGAEVAARELFKRFPKEKYKISVVTSRFSKELPKEETMEGIHVHRVGIGHKHDRFLFPFALIRRALRLKPDVLFCIMVNEAAIGANFLRLVKKIPVAVTFQEGYTENWIKKKFGKAYPLYEKNFNPNFSYQAISKDLMKRCIAHGVPKEQVRLIPNGVDLETFTTRRDEKKVKEIKEKYNIKDTDKVIVTTSRLAEKNAVDDVIKALQYLPQNYKFLICGEGELKEDLVKLQKELKLESRVIFCGTIDYKNIPNYLHASDVFIRPSLAEGFGNSFIEAMACGIPVLATKVGGIPDFLIDEETGLFVKKKNPKDIAEKIKKATTNKKLKEKLRAHGPMKAEEYNWEDLSKMTQEHLDELIEKH